MLEENFLIAPLVKDWLLTYTNQGRSPQTVRTYRVLVGGLVRWWEARQGRELRCRDLGDGDNGRKLIEQYLVARKGDGMKASSARTLLAAVRQFSAWLHTSGYTARDTAHQATGQRVPKRQIAILTDGDITRTEAHLRGLSDAYDALILFRLLLGTGLRRAEAAGLLVRDVLLLDGRGQPLQHGQVTVIGKGDKQRTVGLGLWLTSELRRYLYEARRRRLRIGEPDPANLLLNTFGRPLTPEAISTRFSRWAAALELPKLHPHTLRHTYATHFILSGGDISELMLLLGHASVQQTLHYVQLVGQQHVIERAQTLCPIDARLAAGSGSINRTTRKHDARLTQPGARLGVLAPQGRAQSRRAKQAG